MNYAEIKTYDVANGPGIRVSLFVSGCNHRCPGCFNEQAWDFNYGKVFNDDTIHYIIDTLSFGAYSGVTFLGGEPLERVNQRGLLPLQKRLKKPIPIRPSGALPDMNLKKILWHTCIKNGMKQKNYYHILMY